MTSLSSNAVLPDELVKEILSPLLKLPDELFRDTSYISPFATPRTSCSVVLAVCKQWMRVATPLLYHVVVLRSTAQAQALEYALNRNPVLGTYIRKLRVEGGFGQSMKKIILASPNITDLCVSMDLLATENVTGLVKTMPLMRPSRVILREALDTPVRENKCTRTLTKALCECIETWTTLKVFDYSCDAHHGTPSRALDIAESLARSPSLDTVLVSPLCTRDYLAVISQNTNLRRISVKPLPDNMDALANLLGFRREDYIPTLDDIGDELNELALGENRLAIQSDDRLRSLVVYEEDDEDIKLDIPPPSDPSYTPMPNASDEVKEEIWNRIIQLATWSDIPVVPTRGCLVTNDGGPSDPFPERCDIASVSRLFRRLAEPYLYQDLTLTRYTAIIDCACLLTKKPRLASHIRSLTFAFDFRDDNDDDDDNSLDYEQFDILEENKERETLDGLCTILRMVTNLQCLRQIVLGDIIDIEDEIHLPWDVIGTHISDAAANRVQEMSGMLIGLPPDNAALLQLARFVNLRELRIHCAYKIETLTEMERICNRAPTGSSPSGSLAALKTIAYGEDPFNSSLLTLVNDPSEMPSLLKMLASVELPSLREMNFSTPVTNKDTYDAFLDKHGSKIEHLAMWFTNKPLDSPFQYCRNLKTLYLNILAFRPPELAFFSPGHVTLGALERISFNFDESVTIKTLHHGDSDWATFFKSVDFSAFPSLKEVQIIGCRWPVNEREVRAGNHHWIIASETLMERYSIKLTDGNGNHWIPRLSSAKKRKGVR